MKQQNQISISELQFNLSRTLNQVTDTQIPMLVTNRNKITHQIVPVCSSTCPCNTCDCTLTAEEAGGSANAKPC